MTLDLGDEAASDVGIHLTLPANSSGSAGDAVTWDAANDRVDQVSSTNTSIYGVLAEDSPSTAGNRVGVWVHGPVVASVASGVTNGDIMVGSSTAGQMAASSGVNERTVAIDEGGTTNHGEVALGHPYAISDAGGTNPLQESMSMDSNTAVIMVL